MSQKLDTSPAAIGIDIGKNSFHIVGQNQRGVIVLRQKWSRGQVEARLATCPVPDRHGGPRRRPLSQPQAAGAWAPSTADAGQSMCVRIPKVKRTTIAMQKRSRRRCNLGFLTDLLLRSDLPGDFLCCLPPFFISGFGASAGASSGVPIAASVYVVHIDPPSVDNARIIERFAKPSKSSA